MTVNLMSSYLDADEDVIALTKQGCYRYKHKLKDPQKLLSKLAKADKINLEHWTLQWEFSSAGNDDRKVK